MLRVPKMHAYVWNGFNFWWIYWLLFSYESFNKEIKIWINTSEKIQHHTYTYTPPPFSLMSSNLVIPHKYIYICPISYIWKKNLNYMWLEGCTDVFTCHCPVLYQCTRNSDKGVEIAFLGTRTGLSRTNLFVPADQLSNQWVPLLNISLIITYTVRWAMIVLDESDPLLLTSASLCVCFSRDFLTAEDKEGVFNADHFPLWYKRAAEQVPGTFVYSIPFSTGMQNKTRDKK